MIYFDKATQKAVVERFYRYTEPEGYLFIGHSETIDRSSGLYQYVRPSVHRKIQK
jgi:chemotaxis protein methyltransferase CheR